MKLNTSVIIKKCKPVYLLLAFVLLCSHDLYIKMDSYFLQPNQEATLSLYNGTFENSENIITRDRMQDASVIAQGKRTAISPSNWKDQDSIITQLTFKTGEAGTYMVGVSTKARNIELTSEKFNSYLKNDGVLDMLQQRTNDSLLNQDAVESYQKHVKAIYQVGDVKTNDWNTVLGYPIEFVPQANPYDKYNGDTLEVQLLLDGKPLPNQLVFADYTKNDHGHTHSNQSNEHEHDGEKHTHEHSTNDDGHDHTHQTQSEKSSVKNDHEHEHEHDGEKHTHEHSTNDDGHDHTHQTQSEKSSVKNEHEHEHDGEKHTHEHSTNDDGHDHTHQAQSEKEHTHTSGQQLRTNDKGIVTVKLPEEGLYYLRTINMTRATDSDELTHRSKWATLTFEVSHSHDTNSHTHDHDDENEIPTWVFIVGSILIIGILILIFRKKG